MKTSNVLASFLLSSLAAAAPLNKRDYFTKTELVVETVVVYTTVWGGEAPATAAQATSAPGLFYENKSSQAAEAPAKPTSKYTPPAAPSAPVQQPSSVYTPPAVSTPAPQPSSVYTPPAAPSAPAASSAPAPAPVQSSAAPAPAQSSAPASNNGGGNGQSYHGDITIYDNTGAAGACGKPITDSDKVVALAAGTMGASTYNVMTGEATNPWCGKQIKITYKGKTVDATVMDKCPGCAPGDLDLTYSLWQELTGTTEKTRYQADWTVA